MIGQVIRNLSLLAEYKKVKTLLGTGVWCAAVSPHDLRQRYIPFLMALG